MRPYALFSLIVSCLFATAQAETTKMIITFKGTPAGENLYERGQDGSFSSSTDLTIGSIHILSTLTGKWEGNRIVSYEWVQSDPSTKNKSVITYASGKFHIKAQGTEKDVTMVLKNEPYFGNLHPQFTSSVLSAVDFQSKKSQEFRCFCPDAANYMSPKFTPLTEKVTAAGVAKLFDMQLAPVAGTYAMDSTGRVVALDVPGQMLRFMVPGWESLFKDPFAMYPELSQPTYKFKVEKGVTMKTRDGVTLVQDIVRPDAPGKFPVILERTPYGRGSSAAEGPFYATRGYAFVVQDCRGRSDSGGKWDPFMYDRQDGFDTIQWLAKQPWSDANVGMIGASYGGSVQWAAAVERPSALKCIVPQVSPPDPFMNIPYDNGVFFLWGAVWWGKIVAGKEADMSSFMKKLPNAEGFKTLPLSRVDEAVLGHKIPFYQQWLDRTSQASWTSANFVDDLKNVTIPALHISGWFDGDEIGTMTNWQRMRSAGRKNQWLIYGPWTHQFNNTSKIGDTDFGPDAVIDLDSVYLRWFDTWLKHKQVGLEKMPHVRAFVTGANKWVESSDWPLKESKTETWYLGANGSAVAYNSKGTLTKQIPKGQSPTRYSFDPKVVVIDKRLTDPDPNHVSFVVNFGKDKLGDLLFKSAPLSKGMTVSGPISCDLRFSTSAKDTDFFATIVDIDEHNVAHVVGQAGKIRCTYLNGLNSFNLLKPGKIYSAKFRLWDFAHRFDKGHHLGFILTSSTFPMFARNLGTGEPIKNATKMVIQNQRIYHDPKNPSSVTFQVTD